eukprot:SAG31_NODE_8236_length_1492_cov_1.305097_2_plen_149_part_01
MHALRQSFDVFDTAKQGWLAGWVPRNNNNGGASIDSVGAAECGHALRALLRVVGVPPGNDAALQQRLATAAMGRSHDSRTDSGCVERVWYAQLVSVITEYLAPGTGPISDEEIRQNPAPDVPMLRLPTIKGVHLYRVSANVVGSSDTRP